MCVRTSRSASNHSGSFARIATAGRKLSTGFYARVSGLTSKSGDGRKAVPVLALRPITSFEDRQKSAFETLQYTLQREDHRLPAHAVAIAVEMFGHALFSGARPGPGEAHHAHRLFD